MLKLDRRRIGHMYEVWSKRIFSFVLSALIVASMFAMPDNSKAGHLAGITDEEASRLVGYWDLRDRDSFFQVTNTTGAAVRVHIQVYDASNGCFEFNYFDDLTPRDTHVYDLSNLSRNNGVELGAPDLSGGHGIIAVTEVDATDSFAENDSLTGNFRILDGAGYEYRTNLVGANTTSPEDDYKVQFNGVDGSVFTDVVVLGVNYISDPGGLVPVTEQYDIELFDADENPISCPSVTLGCFAGADEDTALAGGGVINVGINQAVTNSRGGPSLCVGTVGTGFVEIEAEDEDSDAYIHFIGLNNNAGTGSMDSAIADSD